MTHGESGTRLHRIWKAMRTRCHNPNFKSYPNYGGRGIRVCTEWDSYESFRDWAHANGYEDEREIDRIDNAGPYSPENCRWATHSENSRNRRSNRVMSAFGETKTLVEWHEDERCVVADYNTLLVRLRRGWDAEDALTRSTSPLTTPDKGATLNS